MTDNDTPREIDMVAVADVVFGKVIVDCPDCNIPIYVSNEPRGIWMACDCEASYVDAEAIYAIITKQN